MLHPHSHLFANLSIIYEFCKFFHAFITVYLSVFFYIPYRVLSKKHILSKVYYVLMLLCLKTYHWSVCPYTIQSSFPDLLNQKSSRTIFDLFANSFFIHLCLTGKPPFIPLAQAQDSFHFPRLYEKVLNWNFPLSLSHTSSRAGQLSVLHPA